MFRNYLRVFVRTLLKHPGYSVSNILGLAVGMAVCLLILLFVRYEFSWNASNKNYERIFRVQQKVLFKDHSEIYTQTGFPLASELKRQIPEIEEATVLQEVWGEYLSSSDSTQFYEKYGFYADESLFRIFSYNFLEGNPSDALSAPFSIVLTQTLARKYFPGQDPLGKTIRTTRNRVLRITGIIADLPFDLNLRPDYLVSMATLKAVSLWKAYDDLKNIDAAAFQNYVLLKPSASAAAVDDKIYEMVGRYDRDNAFKKFYLKPLAQIHISAGEDSDYKTGLIYLAGTAIFVLLMACINFINLQTASSNLRTKEIGIRKVVGGSKSSLFMQFIAESILYSLLAALVAFTLIELFLPFFNTTVERDLKVDCFGDRGFLLLMAGTSLATGILSGIYPALYLSSFSPIDVLKGNLRRKVGSVGTKSLLRKILVGFQFVISITLIITTTYVMKQVGFMKSKDLGFDKNDLLLCRVFGDHPEGRFETLRNELLRNPEILNATVSRNAPFNGNWGKEITWQGANPGEKMGINFNAVDYDFVETYRMKIVLGRDFSRQHPSDTSACLINETAWKQIGWGDPLGKKIDGNRYTIVGVVRDFHPFSLHEKIPAYYMVLNSGNLKEDGIYSIRVRPGAGETAKRFVDQEFRKFFPGEIVETAAFDSDLNLGTKGVWETLAKLFLAFSVMAVAIAANGLFGLVSFAAQRRIKEIGIRKVFGAKSPGLFLLMSTEILFLLSIAVAIAAPLGFLVSVTTPGAYKYHLHATDYLLAIGLMFATAAAAMLYHTMKAVTSNPVETLKYE
ncbi:MAG TPA: ABC transporter permease [Bacteroidota bacterium]|nr:ABC transporter permease [Bacteroidota bacterium]